MRFEQKLKRMMIMAAMALLLSLTAAAVEPVPLPDFQLTNGNGVVVKSADLPSQGNWLIIYVQPRNQFSDNLLRLFKRDQYPALADHAVIIVNGSVDDMKNMQGRYPELALASWYADSDRGAFTAMKLTGAPTILAIKGRTISWSLSGVPADVNVARSILNTWLQG